jgi:SacI restriction endonuclease
MPSIDYKSARELLNAEFSEVERMALEGQGQPKIRGSISKLFDSIFESSTQAYREVFLGCILARLSDRNIDLTKPYVNQGEDAYNGRTLDETVVNPFLHEKRIPSSKGPFLAAFRRSVRFDEATREGLRDKEGYSALLRLIEGLSKADKEGELRGVLRYTLFRFIALRTASEIPLSRLQRISLEQYGQLIDGLLNTASGGRFPMMLVEATFTAINRVFNLDWEIDVQGINVADKQSGAGADITIKRGKNLCWPPR